MKRALRLRTVNESYILGLRANTPKFKVNAWDFCGLWTVVAALKRDGFPSFATILNGFIDII